MNRFLALEPTEESLKLDKDVLECLNQYKLVYGKDKGDTNYHYLGMYVPGTQCGAGAFLRLL